MKNLLSIIIATAISVVLMSCGHKKCESSKSEARSKLQTTVTGLNDLCPISVGQNISFEDISYDGNTVKMTYMVSSAFIDMDNVRSNLAEFEKNTLSGMVNSPNKEMEALFNLMIEANANLRIIYSTEKNDRITLDFSVQDISKAMSKSAPSSEAMLQALADNAALQTPTTISEGLVMVDVFIENKCFVYLYTCDEDIYDIEEMELESASSKSAMMTYLKADDPVLNQLRKLLKECNYRLAYQYKGDVSGDSFTIYINPDEL